MVITGGSTLLPGMTELAEEIMGVPVRRGVPPGIGGLVDVVKSPVYATGVGLVVYGATPLRPLDVPHPAKRTSSKKVKRRMGASGCKKSSTPSAKPGVPEGRPHPYARPTWLKTCAAQVRRPRASPQPFNEGNQMDQFEQSKRGSKIRVVGVGGAGTTR